MELTVIYKRVIGLDVHPAKISACTVAEQANGKVTVESREDAQGQRLGASAAVRVRAGCGPKSLRAEGQICSTEHSQGPQEIDCGAGAQDAEDRLCGTQGRPTVSRPGGGLRGLECAAQCASLDEDADQARLP
jgi:hypothetical protein